MLNEVLAAHTGRCLDVASACFTVGGYGVVREQLANVGSVQLLPGAEPVHGEQIGSRPDAARVRGLMRRDLDSLAFDEATLRLVEDLIALEAALDG